MQLLSPTTPGFPPLNTGSDCRPARRAKPRATRRQPTWIQARGRRISGRRTASATRYWVRDPRPTAAGCRGPVKRPAEPAQSPSSHRPSSQRRVGPPCCGGCRPSSSAVACGGVSGFALGHSSTSPISGTYGVAFSISDLGVGNAPLFGPERSLVVDGPLRSAADHRGNAMPRSPASALFGVANIASAGTPCANWAVPVGRLQFVALHLEAQSQCCSKLV
jgi:hypothetical protein